MRRRDLSLAALAAYRVTRLITRDQITAPLREAIFDRWPPTVERSTRRWNRDLARLVERPPDTRFPKVVAATGVLDCPWCAGLWVSAAAAALLCEAKGEGVIVTLALSTCVGLLAGVDHALS